MNMTRRVRAGNVSQLVSLHLRRNTVFVAITQEGFLLHSVSGRQVADHVETPKRRLGHEGRRCRLSAGKVCPGQQR